MLGTGEPDDLQQDLSFIWGVADLIRITSRYDFEKLLADAPNLAANLRGYV